MKLKKLRIDFIALNTARRKLQARFELDIADRKVIGDLLQDLKQYAYQTVEDKEAAEIKKSEAVDYAMYEMSDYGEFSENIRRYLLDVIKNTETLLYPSMLQYSVYQHDLVEIEKLLLTNPTADKDVLDDHIDNVREFESKFCV